MKTKKLAARSGTVRTFRIPYMYQLNARIRKGARQIHRELFIMGRDFIWVHVAGCVSIDRPGTPPLHIRLFIDGKERFAIFSHQLLSARNPMKFVKPMFLARNSKVELTIRRTEEADRKISKSIQFALYGYNPVPA